MGRKHSDFMMELFPNQLGVGVDLDNVEIKETSGKWRQFVLKPEDKKAEYFLCYDQIESVFYFVNRLEMPPLRKRRSITVAYAQKLAWYRTDDIFDMYCEVATILKRPEYHIPDYHIYKTHLQEVGVLA